MRCVDEVCVVEQSELSWASEKGREVVVWW